MIDRSRNLDVTEQQIRQQFPGDYAFMKEILYPQLRAVDFRYNLRRVDMVKDTVVLTVLDTTYMRGVQQLRDRDYVGALRTLQVPEPCDRAALAELRRGGFRDSGAAAAGREEPKNRLPIGHSPLAHEPAA